MLNKILLVLTACLMPGTKAYPQAWEYQSPEKRYYMIKAERFREMKTAGIVFTIIGGVAAISGAMKLNSTFFDEGTGLFFGGIATFSAGVTLWIVGGINQKKCTSKAQKLMVRIKSQPEATGLSFAYRF